MSELLDQLAACLGAAHVLTGSDMAPWQDDWTGLYPGTPLAVVRPANTDQVSQVVTLAQAARVPVVPVSGHTGLTGAARAQDALVISLERLNRIREVRADARIAIVEAGVILETLHAAVEPHGLVFPLTFGAKGSARIGGCLATNAGGSNVLRYGNTRDLCLGLEVVMPNGQVMNMMSELHKDNSGYALRHLMIGSEGTLGIITAAVLKLAPRPLHHVTAMLAPPDLPSALKVLHRVQAACDGGVEAFEYMTDSYVQRYLERIPNARAPFDAPHKVNVMLEAAGQAADIADRVEATLASCFEDGLLLDAVVAQSQAQRAEMWARREAAAEVQLTEKPVVDSDIAVPLDQVATFMEQIQTRVQARDPGARMIAVAHLGDGNIHFSVNPTQDDADLIAALKMMIADLACELNGSFSAEHGVGLMKRPMMARHKDPVALQVMQAIKRAVDPHNLMNPGKVLPDGIADL